MHLKYKNCKMLICIANAGIFKKGEKYPFYNIDGYAYLCIVDMSLKKPILFKLDAYEDGTYKIIGTWNEFEDAKFKEVM